MSEPATETRDPATYYDEYGEREWDRLERDFYHRLEFEETVHFLEEYLPDSGRVLDVGGGAFDATLCLGGPLSHVLEESERREAARELERVTAPGGPVFVSVMGRLAALQTVARLSGKRPPERDETELLPTLARTGDYDHELLERFDREPTGPPMHLFRVAELERLLEGAGLTVETVTGLESVVSQRRGDFDELTDEHREALRETVAALRGDRGVADLSGHILAVARA